MNRVQGALQRMRERSKRGSRRASVAADPARRRLLQMIAAAPLLALPARLSLGAVPAEPVRAAADADSARFVLVILRGGLDGLMALPMYGDPHHAALRGELAPPAPGSPGGALDLDGSFALHPELRQLHGLWQAGELLPVHAVATPYRARSHFDAQNVLEIGFAQPDRTSDGWLNRALPALQGNHVEPGRERSVAVGAGVPLVLRGKAPVASWSPDALPAPDPDTFARLQALYARDPVLGPRLTAALEADAMAGGAGVQGDGRGARQEPRLARAAGRMLAHADGPRIAVLDVGGWDTHRQQNASRWRLRVLDQALAELRAAAGDSWRRTVVCVVTEFGRTVAQNGTSGTDHGTGAAAFLLGGAVAGGRVLVDWPSLAPQALLDGRDLRPTLDLRSLLKGILSEHLQVPRAVLERDLFPDSAHVAPAVDLLRA